MKYHALFALCLTCLLVHPALGQDADTKENEQQAKYAKLAETLTNTKFIGQFTVLGKDQKEFPKEEYTIVSATKQAKDEWWLLMARIKYGDKDTTVPVPIRIEWADDTPVMSLSDFTIPGLGTFSCRVVVYNNKYAGTWTHGKNGGHLFGTIEKLPADTDAKPEN